MPVDIGNIVGDKLKIVAVSQRPIAGTDANERFDAKVVMCEIAEGIDSYTGCNDRSQAAPRGKRKSTPVLERIVLSTQGIPVKIRTECTSPAAAFRISHSELEKSAAELVCSENNSHIFIIITDRPVSHSI